MATYLFVVHDLDETSEPILASCEDLAMARREAVRALTELASDKLPTDGDRRNLWVSVQDEGGREVLKVALEFSVTPERANG